MYVITYRLLVNMGGRHVLLYSDFMVNKYNYNDDDDDDDDDK